jgi:hypothetical protein
MGHLRLVLNQAVRDPMAGVFPDGAMWELRVTAGTTTVIFAAAAKLIP